MTVRLVFSDADCNAVLCRIAVRLILGLTHALHCDAALADAKLIHEKLGNSLCALVRQTKVYSTCAGTLVGITGDHHICLGMRLQVVGHFLNLAHLVLGDSCIGDCEENVGAVGFGSLYDFLHNLGRHFHHLLYYLLHNNGLAGGRLDDAGLLLALLTEGVAHAHQTVEVPVGVTGFLRIVSIGEHIGLQFEADSYMLRHVEVHIGAELAHETGLGTAPQQAHGIDVVMGLGK